MWRSFDSAGKDAASLRMTQLFSAKHGSGRVAAVFLARKSRRQLFAVCLDVMFGSFLGVMRGMHMMSVRHVSMMARRLVIPFLMMLRGFAMVVGRMLMVRGGLGVMVRSFLRHDSLPFA
jgi:hypothetical protein